MPNHRIEAFARRVDATVIQFQRHLELWMTREERKQCRPEMHTPESHRRRNTQRTGKTAAALRHISNGLLDVANDPASALQECCPIFGETELARSAVEEGRPQAALDLGQAVTDHRFRQPHAPCGLADRSGLGNSHEGGYLIELQHCSVIPERSIAG